MSMDFEQLLARLSRRMKQLVDQGSLLEGRPVTKAQVREVTDATNEMQRLWKQGRPVQRRQQTVMMPVLWETMTGTPASSFQLGTATDLIDIIDPEATPSAGDFLTIVAQAMLGQAMDQRQQVKPADYLAQLQVPLTALFVYAAARTFGAPNVFDVREDLIERLLLTDVDGVQPRDVRAPFPGFYVALPPGMVEIRNEITGWHQASFVGIAEATAREGPRQGRLFTSLFWCEPNARSTSPQDDHAQVVFTSVPDDWEGSVQDFEATVQSDRLDRAMEHRTTLRWRGQEYKTREAHAILQRFVTNFCLYLSSPNPDIQSATGAKQNWTVMIEKMEDARRSSPHIRRQTTPGKNFNLWDVGRNTRKLSSLPDDQLVRGHWRRQPHGPKWSLRKVIWIEPFVRNKTDSGESLGHDYQVKSNAVR